MNYAGSVVGARIRSPHENQEEEMKRELSDLGFYEEGMTAPEMEQLLSAVNESMNNADEMSRENSLVPMETPQTPSADTTNHKPLRSARDSSSPELPSGAFSNRQKAQNKKPPEDAVDQPTESPEGPTPTTSIYTLSPSPPRIGATFTSASAAPTTPSPPQTVPIIPKKIQTVQPKLHPLLTPKIEMWRIDPFDCKKDDEVPLKKLQRFQGSRPPQIFKAIDGIPQIPEALSKFVDMQLQEAHRSYYQQNKHKFNNEVEWGSPIKVCTGVWNGSFDKEVRPEREIPETRPGLRSQTQEKTVKKSVPDVFTFNNSDNDDDDDDDVFHSSQKRQKPSGSRPTAPTLNPVRRGRTVTQLLRSDSDEKEPAKFENKDPEWEERPRTNSSRKRTVKARESAFPELEKSGREPSPEYEPLEVRGRQTSLLSDSDVVDVSPQYPRRVIPPNPSKPRGPRGRRLGPLLGNRPQLTIERTSRKKQSLTPNEIESIMSEDEDPIFVHQKTTQRAENAVAMLEKAKETEMNEDMERMEMEKMRRDLEDKQKQERVQKKIKEEKRLLRARENENQAEKSRREKYMAGRTIRIGRRTELEGDSSRGIPEINVLNWDANNRPTPSADQEDVDMFPDSSTETKKVQCPLCSKWFPQGQLIEVHADKCAESFGGGDEGENVVDLEVVPRTPSPNVLECMKCCKFQTRNGHEFEEHTTKCMRSDEEKAGGSDSRPIQVQESPPRCFRPVSKLKDSEIDYKAISNARKPSPKGGSRKRRKQ